MQCLRPKLELDVHPGVFFTLPEIFIVMVKTNMLQGLQWMTAWIKTVIYQPHIQVCYFNHVIFLYQSN